MFIDVNNLVFSLFLDEDEYFSEKSRVPCLSCNIIKLSFFGRKLAINRKDNVIECCLLHHLPISNAVMFQK